MADRFHLNLISRARRSRAFSVIELMLAVSLMGVIIYALYAVFNQTQRAMRHSQIQTDVSEKARAVLEMISRELEQAQPTFMAINGMLETNMFGGPEHPPQILSTGTGPNSRADIQPRTNFLHQLFFLMRRTNEWQGVGYRVVNVTNSVGVLQRYEDPNPIRGTRPYSNTVSSAFVRQTLDSTNFYHLADGIIHFSVIPYDLRGYRLGWDTTNRARESFVIQRQKDGGAAIAQSSDSTGTNPPPNVLLREYPGVPAEVLDYGTKFAFLSNAMPSYIDLQLGVLEPEVLTQYYRMVEEQNPNAASFLARQVARVHIFRQRIPIRTAAQ